MNRRAWRWGLLGLAAYLLFLLTTLPAVYATAWLEKRLPEVQLAGVHGSIWSGTARELAYHGRSWGILQWRFDWLAPFSGHWGYRLQLHGSGSILQGRVAASAAGTLFFQDVRGQLPVTEIEPWLPVPPGSVGGTLNLQLARLVLIRGRPAVAEGQVTLTGATLNWPQAVALGNYQMKLRTRSGKGIEGSLLDTGGPLMLQGTLNLAPDGRYQLGGSLAVREPGDAAVSRLLQYLGPVNAAGNHPFQFTGQW